MTKNVYTDEMVEFLRTNVDNYGWAELAQRFNLEFNCNRSVVAIKCFCTRNNNLNVARKSQSPYTEEMASFLSSNLRLEKYTWPELAELFNHKFKCKKSIDTLSHFCCKNEKCSKSRVRRRDSYTEEMSDFLSANFECTSYSELTNIFNSKFNLKKSVGAIKAHCLQKGLEKRIRFTETIVSFLRANFKDISYEELTKRFNDEFNLNKTVSDIKGYCYKYELKKDDTRSLPVGTERLRDMGDGHTFMIVVKVNDRVWKCKHRLVWEQYNGPIPKEHYVIFVDRNTENCSIENLALVSAGELKYLARGRLLQADGELTRIGINIAKIKVKIKNYNKKNSEL